MPDPTKPLKISDKKEFERRQRAYNDSLFAYNNLNYVDDFFGSIKDVNQYAKGIEESTLQHKIDKDYIKPGEESVYSYSELLDPLSLFYRYALKDYKGIKPYEQTYYFHSPNDDYRNRTSEGTVAYEYKKPTQPVEYEKPQKPSYQQIPIKQPVITPIQQSLDEELRTTVVPDAIKYPKDVQRFTAGDYLEYQGKPSGYVNYGDNTGRKDVYQDGGVVLNNDDRSIDSFYTDQQAKSLGFQVSYPYKTLQNPEYKDIRIPQQNPHFMEPLREKKIQYRQVPMNIEDGTSMLDNNNDIGFLFNKKFGI